MVECTFAPGESNMRWIELSQQRYRSLIFSDCVLRLSGCFRARARSALFIRWWKSRLYWLRVDRLLIMMLGNCENGVIDSGSNANRDEEVSQMAKLLTLL